MDVSLTSVINQFVFIQTNVNCYKISCQLSLAYEI